MKKSEWSDKQLEELLRQMPKIQDHRDPRDIYENLPVKKSRASLLLLLSIAAAALALLIVFTPKITDGIRIFQNEASEQKSADNHGLKGGNNGIIVGLKKENALKEKEFLDTKNGERLHAGFKTAVYADDVGKGTVLTYWIPDPQAQILVPVSMIAANTEKKSWLTLFNKKMAALKEEDWGLSEFYPMNATMKLDDHDGNVSVDVPINHSYGHGSTNETTFLEAIEKNVSTNSNIKKIRFLTNGHPGINLGNFGEVKDLNIHLEKNHAYLFYYPRKNQPPFIVPTKDQYTDIRSALEAMESDQPEAGLKTSLQPSWHIKNVLIQNKTLFLSVDVHSKLKNDEKTLHSFEAILLTAKEFGVDQVVIENTPLTTLGSFNLTKKVEVPIAPNLRLLQ